MTKQEAIKILEQICPKRPQKLWSIKRKEAATMAIEALTHFNSIKTELNDELSCSEKQNRSDLISRQDAIDAIENVPDYNDGMVWEALSHAQRDVALLPSAQPEQHWIPWDNGKFPEESGTYNVTAYDGVTNRVTHAKYQKRLKRWELTGARVYWRVLAWMPLPEPYREGEQDE